MVGVPSILKTRRMGYDGKGQARLTDAAQATAAWESLGGVPCILEGFVRFDAEVSLIAARGRTGQIVFYPLTENFHRDGILRCSVAPFHDGALQRAAEVHLLALLEKMDYAGVLAVEFFVQGGKLLANEMAPRVHNSGHWTIEGSKTSQFENHLRAILGMDLGGTDTQGAVMLNCIGAMPPADETAQFPALHRHDYGKEPRPGRKVGHITFPVSASKDIYEWQKRLGVV
jgi:5-(carboxyamino)imidazole ribonucleotide synthase